jgi:hypothetical protein
VHCPQRYSLYFSHVPCVPVWWYTVLCNCFIFFLYLFIWVRWWWLEAVLLGIIPSPVTTSVVIVLVSPGLFCNSRVLHPLRSLVLVMQLCVFDLRVEPIFLFIIYLCRTLWGSCQDLSSRYVLDTCPRVRSLETWRLPIHSLEVASAIPGILFQVRGTLYFVCLSLYYLVMFTWLSNLEYS